jgi:hypothetical protein
MVLVYAKVFQAPPETGAAPAANLLMRPGIFITKNRTSRKPML